MPVKTMLAAPVELSGRLRATYQEERQTNAYAEATGSAISADCSHVRPRRPPSSSASSAPTSVQTLR